MTPFLYLVIGSILPASYKSGESKGKLSSMPRFFFKTKIILLMALQLLAVSGFAQSTVDRKKLADEVKTEFLHAWNGYKKYAWGNDDLKPLSKSFHNWYPQPLLMTPVDALDTMYIMGLKKEADETRKYITENLRFDKDISVQNFEITIRLLGGLLSAYQIRSEERRVGKECRSR